MISNCQWVPKEVSTAALGVTLAAASNVARELLCSSFSRGFVRNVVMYCGSAAAFAGAVVAVYATFRSCKKILSERDDLQKTITVTALGSAGLALAEALTEHFWTLAPSFGYLEGHSLAYCIATNFAWEACAIAGLGSIVFTAYAAYRTGQAILRFGTSP
jgi:hypothetical protein